MLKQGEQLHVITRRGFAEEGRRHFAGRVLDSDDGVVKLEGYSFSFNMREGKFERVSEARVRFFSLLDAANVITMIPAEIDLTKLGYEIAEDRQLLLVDGNGFRLELSELTRH